MYLLKHAKTKLLQTCLLNCLLSCSFAIYENVKDMDLSPPELILKYDFPLEAYRNVSTPDGYLLDIYRIVGVTGSIPVLLMHGLVGSSRNYLVNGKNDSLAFILHRRGFDVWLGNARGTNYARNHKTLDPFKDMKYWDFSLHEIGVYDIPTMIDLITEVTGHERLFYIGHSQGTTVFFILNAYRPEYNKKFLLCVALGPSAYVRNHPSPMVHFLSSLESIIFKTAKQINFRIFPPKDFLYAIVRKYCQQEGGFRDSCASVWYQFAGYSPKQLDISRLATYLGDGISTASLFQFLNYAQILNTDQFRGYDWHSPEENIEHYGTPTPPMYNLSNITAPVAIYYTKNDKLTGYIDVTRLSRKLPNCVLFYKVPDREFNHFDLIFGKDAKKLVFNHAIGMMKKYEHGQENLKETTVSRSV